MFTMTIDSPLGHRLHKAGFSAIHTLEDLAAAAAIRGLTEHTVLLLIQGELRMDPIIAHTLGRKYGSSQMWMETQSYEDQYWTKMGVADAHLKTHTECDAIITNRETLTRMLES